jgi:hypothetical protein
MKPIAPGDLFGAEQRRAEHPSPRVLRAVVAIIRLTGPCGRTQQVKLMWTWLRDDCGACAWQAAAADKVLTLTRGWCDGERPYEYRTPVAIME